MSNRIFICYSKYDHALVEPLAHLLRKSFDHVWFDENLHGGEEWWSEILKAIRACDHFIFMMTNDALNSEWCQREITEARRLYKHILPVLSRGGTNVPPELIKIQYVNMTEGITVEALNLLYATIIRHKGEQQTLDVQEHQRKADERLLEQLWPFVNGGYVEILCNETQARQVDWEKYTAHIVKYLDLRGKQRNHFFNPTLEGAFESFDDALIRLDGQLAWTYEMQEQNGRAYMTVPRSARNDSWWMEKYNKLVKKSTDVWLRHIEMVRAVQTVIPNFELTTEN
jgi:hypothetical protein